MGKIGAKEAKALKDSGILTKKSEDALSKITSKKKSRAMKRFVKTEDGYMVEPMLYFRGGKGKKPSSDMKAIIDVFDKAVTKYSTTK